MMIRISGLNKVFSNGHKALDKLSLDVSEGEIFALLGPNGAGKTTTIKILSTLSGFDEGEVQVAGCNVDTDWEPVRRAIGVVAQQTGVDYFLSGRENLTLQGHMYRMKKADIAQRIEQLAEHFGLTDALDRQVMTYSGGMRRKLDIATALIHRPKVLFLDEPTLGLDIKSRQNLWSHIEQLNKEQGLTILLTTHYLEEADHLSHRVAIINNGKIQVVDTPEALKNTIHGDGVILTFKEQGTEVGEFTFRMHDDPNVRDVVWDNDKMHLYVDNGSEMIPNLVRIAGECGVTIKTLSLARPSLDDVFLKYTGTTLEDANSDEGGEEWWHQWAGKGGGGGKWQKNWEKWQQQLEDSGEEETKQEWQTQMAKWQNQPSTGDDSDSADTAQSADWQKWQQPAQNAESDADTRQEDAGQQPWPNNPQREQPAQHTEAAPGEPQQTAASNWPTEQKWPQQQPNGSEKSDESWPKDQQQWSNNQQGNWPTGQNVKNKDA